jgi:hypothetical protein
MIEKSSWVQAYRPQKRGLVWRNRKKTRQVIKDYFYLPFFPLIILCMYRNRTMSRNNQHDDQFCPYDMPDGWEYWDTQVYLFHVISIGKKTKKNISFKGQRRELVFCPIQFCPSCLERTYLKVSEFDLLLTKVGRVCSFGAVGKCAKCTYICAFSYCAQSIFS